MRPYGKVNLGSLALLLAVAAGVGFVVNVAPAYLDNLSAADLVGTAALDATLGKSDEEIASRLLFDLNAATLGSHRERDEAGAWRVVPGLGVARENIVIDRSNPKQVRVRVDYGRDVQLKPLNKWIHLNFSPEKRGPKIK